jgi:hypothetical protein
MIPVETVQEWGGVKRNDEGVTSSLIYLIYIKNFCKCHNVLPPSTTIKKRKKEQAVYWIDHIDHHFPTSITEDS